MSTIDFQRFLSPRGGSNYWARREDLIAAWQQNSQLGVPPLALEWAPILDCNARCPLCPYHRAQIEQCHGVIPIGELAIVNERTAASMKLARTVLERSREAKVSGVLVTGGGEPTIWRRSARKSARSFTSFGVWPGRRT